MDETTAPVTPPHSDALAGIPLTHALSDVQTVAAASAEEHRVPSHHSQARHLECKYCTSTHQVHPVLTPCKSLTRCMRAFILC